MKKIGRGASYRTALLKSLVKSLLDHKKIQTGRVRGKLLALYARKRLQKNVTVKSAGNRRGDNSSQVTVEIS